MRTEFHSWLWPWNADWARENDDTWLVSLRVAVWVSPRVSASSSGMRTDWVVDCVENASWAPPQSSPLVWVSAAYDTTSTVRASVVVARSSCIGSQVTPGSM